MGLLSRFVLLVSLVAAIGACSSSQPLSILSDPDTVSVAINGKNVGTTPTKYDFQFPEESTRYTVRGSKEGYHDNTVEVSAANFARLMGTVTLTLEPHNKSAVIRSTPSQASVRVGEHDVGQTPTSHSFDFSDRRRRYMVTVSKTGYFDRVVTVTEGSGGIRSGTIDVVLEENPAWTTTSESEATNKWLRIAVDRSIAYDNAWQKIIDSVTSVYDSLEQLDQTSGYLRSTPRVREFAKGPAGPFLVRTQFIGSISSKDPLTYKIKLTSTTRAKSDAAENWKEFDRVFSEDAQLVEELQSRLGLK